MGRGEVDQLKPEDRLALAKDDYALVKCELARRDLIKGSDESGGNAAGAFGAYPSCGRTIAHRAMWGLSWSFTIS